LLSLSATNQGTDVGLNTPQRSVAFQQSERVAIVVDTNTNTHPQVEEVRVDMAYLKVDNRPVELVTSLGSCIGICLYDSLRRCGGLAHIMLPHSSLGSQEPLPSKYADTAIIALIDGIRALTGKHNRLSAKIAGGANMFANTSANGLDIGKKNINAVHTILEENHISLLAEDVGGNHGRRINFSLITGEIVIRLHNGEIRKL
jgi:chemotaxis protein CheD